jgi:stage V sporulation protein S
MNRFFSKLNLNDIKIKAEGNSFPPDADDAPLDERETATEVGPEVENQAVETGSLPSFFQPTSAKTREIEQASDIASPIEEADTANSAVSSIEEADMASFETEEVDDVPLHSNGHSDREISYEESTALYATADVMVEERVTEIVSEGIVIGIGEVLKVSARSRPSAVAGAIAGVVREAGRAEVQAIGAGATNQAIKAVAIARDYLSESGIEAICVPAFIDVTIENEDRTAIRLVVEPR